MNKPPAPPLELFPPDPDTEERVWVPAYVRRTDGKDIYVAGHWRLKTKARRRLERSAR